MQPAKATVNQTKNIAERKRVSNYIRERSRKHETNSQKDLGEGVKKTREAEPEMQRLFVGRKPADRKLRNRRRKTSTLRIEEDMKEESMTANPLIKEPKRYRIKPRAEAKESEILRSPLSDQVDSTYQPAIQVPKAQKKTETLYITDGGIFSAATIIGQDLDQTKNEKRHKANQTQNLSFLKSFLKSFHKNSTIPSPIQTNHEHTISNPNKSDINENTKENDDLDLENINANDARGRRKTIPSKRWRKPILVTRTNTPSKIYLIQKQDVQRRKKKLTRVTRRKTENQEDVEQFNVRKEMVGVSNASNNDNKRTDKGKFQVRRESQLLRRKLVRRGRLVR